MSSCGWLVGSWLLLLGLPPLAPVAASHAFIRRLNSEQHSEQTRKTRDKRQETLLVNSEEDSGPESHGSGGMNLFLSKLIWELWGLPCENMCTRPESSKVTNNTLMNHTDELGRLPASNDKTRLQVAYTNIEPSTLSQDLRKDILRTTYWYREQRLTRSADVNQHRRQLSRLAGHGPW